MESTEEFSYHVAVKANIAICAVISLFMLIKEMEEHWRTNCTGNRHCDISFKEYMELKQKPEVERDIYTRLAIHQYELRIENLIRRVKHIRETAKRFKHILLYKERDLSPGWIDRN
ncbi:hypothetical protein Glove_332g4 [Diversispora epigaea]|uniref:Uncharacterized protein n=1 Tax=Diversispora epigaea TaxID=1348612 RepID=A0A397HMF9_9GLOM|nr:hypothetical protein Glove_332g4 [Diversispora epigaea]